MDYYEIPNPYGESNSYYTDHYICLWEVTDDETIGHWEWDDLSQNDRWYEEIILPAFIEHDKRALASPLNEGVFNLESILDVLPGTVRFHETARGYD